MATDELRTTDASGAQDAGAEASAFRMAGAEADGRQTASAQDDTCVGAAVTEDMPDEELLYDLADLFRVFGDTTRIKILYALMDGDLCVAHLAESVGMSQSAVSHQLRALKSARLVRFRRDGKNVIYSLSDDHVHSILAQGMSHICE